jgi:transcriptional regulator with XRE-family HTH domain
MSERKTPHPVDVHVGRRLKHRREQLGLSQVVLAGSTGVTYQQIQKYETARDRVSASRLHDMAETLGVPVGYFFEDLPHGEGSGCSVGDPSTEP